MIVTVGHTKGGAGKTTIALQLALHEAAAGHQTWLIDGDRQGTAMSALAVRAAAGKPVAVAAAQYTDGGVLEAQLSHQAGRFARTVIDAGGRDNDAMRHALAYSDLLLIPFAPRSFDLWALDDMAELVSQAQVWRANRGTKPLRLMAVINQADPAGADNDAARDLAQGFADLYVLPMQIHRRKAYSNASGQGLSVAELRPKDQKACDEISQLAKLVFNNGLPIK